MSCPSSWFLTTPWNTTTAPLRGDSTASWTVCALIFSAVTVAKTRCAVLGGIVST